MRELERTIENYVVKWARARNIDVIKLNLQGMRSYPDRLFFIPGGKPLLIEFKRLGLKPSKLQQVTIDRLAKLGYDVESHDTREGAIRALERALETDSSTATRQQPT